MRTQEDKNGPQEGKENVYVLNLEILSGACKSFMKTSKEKYLIVRKFVFLPQQFLLILQPRSRSGFVEYGFATFVIENDKKIIN
jgi:hypothetical protein